MAAKALEAAERVIHLAQVLTQIAGIMSRVCDEVTVAL